MDEKGMSGSITVGSEDSIDTLYPMLFGVSCAFFALRLLPEQPELCDDMWSQVTARMLQGSSHLLGLLVWRVQRDEAKSRNTELLKKLEDAEKQVQELKKRRSEDARANEKVVRIVATREQSWSDERKKLRQQIGGLMNDLRVVKMKSERSIAELNQKLKENEAIMHLKDKSIEEVELKRVEIDEKVNKAENLLKEMRENAQREAQRHASETLKHKTAFIELVSSQRQLEAEMSRAVRQVEVAKQELDSVLDQKEQAVLMTQKLSMELVKTRKDLDQKDQILSAMLRKSKVDTAELLKEVKSSKAKRQQTEVETAGWKAVSETKHDRHSLRNILSKHVSVKSDIFSGGKGGHLKAMASLDAGNPRAAETDYREFEQPQAFKLINDPYLIARTGEPHLIADVEGLENWTNSEAATYEFALQQRHNLEIDAFVDQLRLKDERLEAFRWRLLSMEIESKRLHSHIETIDHEITQLRKENMRLEALLLDRETELHSLKEQLLMQFNPPNLQKLNFESSLHEATMNHNTVWSRVKVVKRKPGQRRKEMNVTEEETPQAAEVCELPSDEQLKDIVLTLKYPHKEIQDWKVASLEQDHCRQGSFGSDDAANVETTTSAGQGSSKKSNSTLKLDIHALGVSYKIKRLKQQFLMLERLMGKQENSEVDIATKGLYALTTLLNKQVDRYQSLQGKIDDLCQRMDEKNLNLSCRGNAIARTDDETKRLEHFLEETFQLQRYIVATGQKLMEVQAKIASGFIDFAEKIDQPESFDMKRFADSIRTLFREVQRGLEVRISRIIGDLEGTLACDGIINLKK
ncbi:putative WEB family protein At1g65010, chloroplastic [Salvia miltiorrhiza]|uniref:putative WEB family protein At1g65010, chloroplastic n=1 Tax=Salvia miltiorrhiza TaxID=226208 RepID=UPI0025AC2A10|nr:putative WEB family protein At1g65010, chloroplastic [Salvia miltiorrhiza]